VVVVGSAIRTGTMDPHVGHDVLLRRDDNFGFGSHRVCGRISDCLQDAEDFLQTGAYPSRSAIDGASAISWAACQNHSGSATLRY
jgi:hypothetical protein